jgi:hypothetical protein
MTVSDGLAVLSTIMLSENDIESELSYAYLHAVSAQASDLFREIATRVSLGEDVVYGK